MFRLSQPEGTKAGDFLAYLYYRTSVFQGGLLRTGEAGGYPHNGGSHTLFIRDEGDAAAFVDLVEEEYSHVPGCREFVQNARETIASRKKVYEDRKIKRFTDTMLPITTPKM